MLRGFTWLWRHWLLFLSSSTRIESICCCKAWAHSQQGCHSLVWGCPSVLNWRCNCNLLCALPCHFLRSRFQASKPEPKQSSVRPQGELGGCAQKRKAERRRDATPQGRLGAPEAHWGVPRGKCFLRHVPSLVLSGGSRCLQLTHGSL